MAPQEAINRLKNICFTIKNEPEEIEAAQYIGALKLAISALEKQVPEKPILKDGEMLMHVNNGDKPHEWKTSKWQDWVCPECGCFVGQRYNSMQRRPHDQRKCNYCNDCGQAIDWSEGE